ncbi:NAD(P)H-quinone oxidoreductase [Tomitella biformata]|uniref:NAD(P)H-quinone oxidoreductase n=1 Tax=Tomitella biformata TaxID=630403 RepID=UPI0004653124|nr:NAD(P)H-quinone oxidoreductase [Tomitella biformata]
MRAICLDQHGSPENMVWGSAATPEPSRGEVLIDIAATAVNRADLLQRQGNYPPPPGASEILGLECSGVISAVGPDVARWKVGQQVCALLVGGGYAEQVVVPATQLMPVPDGMDIHVAAALPEVACTVWSNMVSRAGLHHGQTVLIHGGAGGIGTHAIQVAKALGARVAVTAGSADKLERCRELGADIAINYREEDFVERLKMAEPIGADVILDNMGAKYLARNIAALAPDGWLSIIGMQGGVKAELNIAHVMAKRARITATGLRGRPTGGAAGKAAIVTAVVEHVWPMIRDGRVLPVVHAELPIAEAAQAHRLLDSGEVVGKVILRVR